jgi:hypothetical protein
VLAPVAHLLVAAGSVRPSAHNGTVLGVSGPLHRQPIPQALTTPYPKPSSGASLFRNLAVVAALTARLLLAPSVG